MTHLEKVYNWLNADLLRLYAPTCTLCSAPLQRAGPIELCAGCRQELPWNHHSCRTCGLPLPDSAAEMCGGCLRQPPPVTRARVPLLYVAPVDHLLRELKFNGRLQRARLLGHLVADALAEAPPPDLLIPVPLHPSRLRSRGYNQALELARPVARRLGVGVSDGLCRRQRRSESQSRLSLTERRRNVRDAFVARPAVAGRRVAIFDDVVTSGSTTTEMARSLLRAGAAEVEVWAVARAPTPGS